MSVFKKIIMNLLLFSLLVSAKAAVPGSLWHSLSVLGGNEVAYDYKIQLVAGNGGVTDSINGTLYKSGRKYMDSSSVGITVVNGAYFCKLDYDHKVASVYDVKRLTDEMHMSIDEPSRFYSVFTDSVIVKYGKMSVDTSSSNYYLISIQFLDQNISSVHMYLSRSTREIQKLVLESPDPIVPGETERYSRVYTIYNIRGSIGSDIFDLTRFFTITNKQVTLSKKYSNYKVKATLN